MNQAIIITGKGFPDYATKQFVKKLICEKPNLPVFFLGDFDPYGFDILCNYCFEIEMNIYEFDNIP